MGIEQKFLDHHPESLRFHSLRNKTTNDNEAEGDTAGLSQRHLRPKTHRLPIAMTEYYCLNFTSLGPKLHASLKHQTKD